jgi:hypothetical protein
MIQAALDIAFDDPLIRHIVTLAVRFVALSRLHCHPKMFERTMASTSRSETIRHAKIALRVSVPKAV